MNFINLEQWKKHEWCSNFFGNLKYNDDLSIPVGPVILINYAQSGFSSEFERLSCHFCSIYQIENKSLPGMYMVPVWGYDNFLAVSKFAEYLDSASGALHDTEYCMKRAKIMAKHSRQIELEQQLQEHPEDEDDSDSLVIDGVDSY